ncbi:protein phosphatase 1 regulatory subunit 16A X3 [Biomphalaria glabrata]|nr:protein phosphatase 1 regulatory subunit 16A X3 [Biomphalaria glabrata]
MIHHISACGPALPSHLESHDQTTDRNQANDENAISTNLGRGRSLYFCDVLIVKKRKLSLDGDQFQMVMASVKVTLTALYRSCFSITGTEKPIVLYCSEE